MELRIYEETGGVLSQTGAEVYYAARSFGDLSVRDAWSKAIIESKYMHARQIKEWGSLEQYIKAHGEFGQELLSVVDGRSLISFTTDPAIAAHFAGEKGIIIHLKIPRSQLIEQTLATSTESEVLIINGVKK